MYNDISPLSVMQQTVDADYTVMLPNDIIRWDLSEREFLEYIGPPS
jgi:hypothetical protein